MSERLHDWTIALNTYLHDAAQPASVNPASTIGSPPSS
jgi:hypothetical protein